MGFRLAHASVDGYLKLPHVHHVHASRPVARHWLQYVDGACVPGLSGRSSGSHDVFIKCKGLVPSHRVPDPMLLGPHSKDVHLGSHCLMCSNPIVDVGVPRPCSRSRDGDDDDVARTKEW